MEGIYGIETIQEHYEREIASCVRCVMDCKVDLAQSQRCLDRCDDDRIIHWEICVAVHEKELQTNEERLKNFKARLMEINIREGLQEREECEYRN